MEILLKICSEPPLTYSERTETMQKVKIIQDCISETLLYKIMLKLYCKAFQCLKKVYHFWFYVVLELYTQNR